MRKSNNQLTAFERTVGLPFTEAQDRVRRDRVALFHGGKSRYDKEEIPLTDEIRERNALALALGQNEYEIFVDSLYHSLRNGAVDRAPAPIREKIRAAVEAQEASRRRSYERGDIPFFSRIDEIKTATTLFDGGNFYQGVMILPGARVPVRVKQYGDPAKFKRGLPVQRFLQRLHREGIIRARINQPAVVEESRGLIGELHLEGKRLIDVLRTLPDDSAKARLMEETIRDYMEVSVRATEYKDLRVDARDARQTQFVGNRMPRETDEGSYYLRANEGFMGGVRNTFWRGNYIIPDQGDPVDNFLRVFALRASPHLRNTLLDSKGRVRKWADKLNHGSHAYSRLSDGLWNLVKPDFNKRRKYIVNLDANTSQVLITPDGRRVYTDWDHTYFGLVEEQLAELLLTSTIKDQRVIDGLIHKAYKDLSELAEFVPHGSESDFMRITHKKLVEKLLGRAARFRDVAHGVEDGQEQRTLENLANQAYTLSLRYLDRLEGDAGKLKGKASGGTLWTRPYAERISFAKETIKEFNRRQNLGLEEVVETHGFGEDTETIGSIVSSVHNRVGLETMKSDYRLPFKPFDWERFWKNTKYVGIAAAIAFGAVFTGVKMRHFDTMRELEAASKYSGKEIVMVDPHADEAMTLYRVGDAEVHIPAGVTLDSLLRSAYEIGNAKDNQFLVEFLQRELEFARNDVKRLEEDGMKCYEASVIEIARDSHTDPDLIRAIILTSGTNPLPPSGMKGPMEIPANCDYLRLRGYDPMDLTIPHVHIRVGTDYLRQCVAHNEGSLVDSLAEYYVGVYDLQRAMIKAKSQNYGDYRKELPSWAITRIDHSVGHYLDLKGLLDKKLNVEDK